MAHWIWMVVVNLSTRPFRRVFSGFSNSVFRRSGSTSTRWSLRALLTQCKRFHKCFLRMLRKCVTNTFTVDLLSQAEQVNIPAGKTQAWLASEIAEESSRGKRKERKARNARRFNGRNISSERKTNYRRTNTRNAIQGYSDANRLIIFLDTMTVACHGDNTRRVLLMVLKILDSWRARGASLKARDKISDLIMSAPISSVHCYRRRFRESRRDGADRSTRSSFWRWHTHARALARTHTHTQRERRHWNARHHTTITNGSPACVTMGVNRTFIQARKIMFHWEIMITVFHEIAITTLASRQLMEVLTRRRTLENRSLSPLLFSFFP